VAREFRAIVLALIDVVGGSIMCFQRQPGLGRYNSGRSEWLGAYRTARISAAQGFGPDAANDGVWWKAELIVQERAIEDQLMVPVVNRLAAQRVIEDILNES